jgi:hypothetical protein
MHHRQEATGPNATISYAGSEFGQESSMVDSKWLLQARACAARRISWTKRSRPNNIGAIVTCLVRCFRPAAVDLFTASG